MAAQYEKPAHVHGASHEFRVNEMRGPTRLANWTGIRREHD
jgi:hypothetical protein